MFDVPGKHGVRPGSRRKLRYEAPDAMSSDPGSNHAALHAGSPEYECSGFEHPLASEYTLNTLGLAHCGPDVGDGSHQGSF